MSISSSQKIVPCLWFDTNAEDAVRFYTSIFKNSRILQTSHYGDGGMMPKGMVMTIDFELAGQKFMALNAGPHFKFNEAISLSVSCDSQAEIDDYWTKLTADGGAPVQCGWLKDRFGLSWQIVPSILPELMKNQAATDKIMLAVMQMVKLDIAAIKAAAQSA